ncbi:hypothetical protein BH09PAT1_BH09PAT1_2110 [soil metagenome]
MSKRRSFISVFVFFLFSSFFLYGLSFTPVGQGITGGLEYLTRPLSYGLSAVYAATKGQPSELQKLKDENSDLRIKLAGLQTQQKEIQALRDQFQISTPQSSLLLSTQIIGLKAFLPGVSLPEQLVIDKGKKDGVKTNDAVVYKNNLIGKVVVANDRVSLVDLAFKKGFSVTATTTGSNALGISNGQGQGSILLNNVVLSDTLNSGDMLITKGGTDSDESGIPPNLVIGKITSVDKKASSLFQTANVQPQIDITRVTHLFIVLRSE